MWCDKCQADVAAVASPDNERLHCTTCGGGLPRPVSASAPIATPVSKSGDSARPLTTPRELLARWAREDALEPFHSGVAAAKQVGENPPTARRFDQSHALGGPPQGFVDRAAEAGPIRAPAPALAEQPAVNHDYIVHQPHAPEPPHFQSAPVAPVDKSSRLMTLIGQIFAYVGVGGLTIGTVLVLVGYFGGPASYATTGWLVTTAGQMLLFLGVVTLISGGMEQTTQEVARRIDTLGERLIRIEHAAWNGQPGSSPAPQKETTRVSP